MPVAVTFAFEDVDGTSLSQLAELDTMVSVVDASTFLDEVGQEDLLCDRALAAAPGDDRALSNLLIDQIEAAALLPGWLRELDGFERVPETEEYGISSFVYRARRPFHPARLAAAADELHGILRSKGAVWLASRPDVCGTWSQAGPWLRLEPAGWWLADTPHDEWDLDADEERALARIWDHTVGDRRQEIVVIGKDLDPDAVHAALDPALLDDREFAAGADVWRQLPDPLPAWDVAADGYVHDHDDEADHVHATAHP